ncbi:hypothetical protein FNV43_RR03089 [Rhamnella rubrinervis]|uniref:Uncharacterized protein n=1 Tax=Rhamnella rubrinervis TaxID=2594499 RepID=A0A8K0HH46_9ROSA|nr:hypothetical protein FNV43_RR03089 [Rhamnella rubrinervis]
MASLTQGVLSKLLNNAANEDVKVTGDHRSALLQVIEILPSAADDDDEPWSSRGFFIKVSDSLHCAYVSVSDHDLDLIYSDKIQLGQFVYVTRLDSASPVPVVRGLKPVPRRRPGPCVGNPIDLVPSDLLQIRGAGKDFTFEKSKSKGGKVVHKGLKRGDSSNGNVKSKGRNSVSSESAAKSRFGSSVKDNGGSPVKKTVNEGLDIRRLSLDSARRAWDYNPTSKNTAQVTTSRFKSKQVTADKKTSREHDSSVKCPSLSNLPLKTKNEIFPTMTTNKTPKKDLKSSLEVTIPNRLIKVPLCFKTWSEQKISWDVMPAAINDLGKQAVHHRNAAFLAAVRSLEEASAVESVIHCMCVLAEVCESSQKASAGELVQKFLELNQSLLSAAMVVSSLLNSRPLDSKPSSYSNEQHWLPDTCKISARKNATSWVKAAVETNLSKFNLFRIEDKCEVRNGEKCHFVVLEKASAELNSENVSPGSKQSPRNHGSSLSDSNSKSIPSSSRQFLSTRRKLSTEREESLKGSKLKEAATLADKLLLVSRQWFLKYLEDSLTMGFGLKRMKGGSETASLLRQLKKVNQWLDDLVTGGIQEDERIEDLRKKLYRFLLEHVDSAVVSSSKFTE